MVKVKKLLPDKKTFLSLLFIFLAALLLRIEYIRNTIIDNPIRADAREYVLYGYNIVNHGTFSMQYNMDNPVPDGHRTLGYPLLIVLALLLGKQDFYQFILYIQAAMSAFTVLLTYYIGIRFMPFRWAITAASLVAFSPHLVSMNGYVLTETLYSFVLLVAISCFYLALKHKNIFIFFLSAFFFGYAYLTTPTMLFIPFIFAAVVILYRYTGITATLRNSFFKKIAIFLIIFSLFPIGWSVRNKLNIPPGSVKGTGRLKTALAHGAYPGYIYKNPKLKYYPYRDDPQWEEFRSSFTRIFWERFKQRPVRFIVWYLFEKPYIFWSWNILQGQGDVYVYPVRTSLYQTSELANLTRMAMKLIHPVVQLLMLAGLPLFYITGRASRKNNPGNPCDNPIFILAIILYYTLMFMVLNPLTRYAVPLRPQQYLWALWSLHTGIVLIRSRLPRSASDEIPKGKTGKDSRKKSKRRKSKKA